MNILLLKFYFNKNRFRHKINMRGSELVAIIIEMASDTHIGYTQIKNRISGRVK